MNSLHSETKPFIIFLFLLFGSPAILPAQKAPVSPIEQQKAIIRKIYSESIEVPDEFINGKEYEPYYRASVFKPLLFPERKKSVMLLTATRKYDGLNLQYDTFLDELFYTDTSRMINSMYPLVALNKDIAQGFIFFFTDDTMYFTYHNQGNGLSEGYYETALIGNITYLIRHRSSYFTREAVPNYRYSPVNMLAKENGFVTIQKKRDLLKFLDDRSGKVKEYLHRNKIKVRKITKDQMIRVLNLSGNLAANR